MDKEFRIFIRWRDDKANMQVKCYTSPRYAWKKVRSIKMHYGTGEESVRAHISTERAVIDVFPWGIEYDTPGYQFIESYVTCRGKLHVNHYRLHDVGAIEI